MRAPAKNFLLLNGFGISELLLTYVSFEISDSSGYKSIAEWD